MAYPKQKEHIVPPIPSGYSQVEESTTTEPPLPTGYVKKNPMVA